MEHPSEVKSSTNTGVRPLISGIDPETGAHVAAVIESTVNKESNAALIGMAEHFLMELMPTRHESYLPARS